MPIWHQSPKLTPRYFLETPRLFGYSTFHFTLLRFHLNDQYPLEYGAMFPLYLR